MRILVDTNVLIRVAHQNHPHQPVANAALQHLWGQQHELRIVPQVLYEYWVVATRPVQRNGLGFTAAVADADVTKFKSVFSVLRDERGILDPWQQFAANLGVLGKQAHDARLVAAMQRHGLTHLLTFNAGDFRRYATIQLLDPHSLTTTSP